MKSKILIPLLTLSLIVAIQPVFAEETRTITPKTTRNQIREEIREERQEAKATIAQIRTEKKAALSETKQNRLQNIYHALLNGLTNRHETFLKIKAKIEARITKNPMNKKTDDAQKILDIQFKDAESKYQKDLIALDAKFAELKASSKPGEIIQGLKDSVKLVREDLNAIKKALTSAITTLAKAPKLETTKTQ